MIAAMERNVRLYPHYHALFALMAWLPIFFLFFSDFVSLDQVLQLEAIYYFTVVLIEVPSGYFSDRFGRRPTLVISALAMSTAYLFFVAGSSFGAFAVGQILLAVGFGFRSGSDTSLHFDSLAALERTEEYGQREAIAARNGFVTNAAGTLLGGILGLWSFRYAYAISLLGMLGALAIVLKFREPPQSGAAPGILVQVRRCVVQARQRPLTWLLIFAMLMTVLNHIPYEFYQPYLDLLAGNRALFSVQTPLLAGIVMAISKLLGALAANHSIRIRERIGTARTLLLATTLQTLLIGVMGLILHPLIVLLILLRDVPGSLAQAPLNAAVTPRVHQTQRATYLSLQSLAGRLAFSMVLFGLSLAAGENAALSWPALAAMLHSSVVIALLGLGLLLWKRSWITAE